MPRDRKGGVSGTVDAFNFIRRVGFPSTRRVIVIFAAIALFSASISLLPANEGPGQTLVFAGAVLVWPTILGEFLNSTLILHKEKILDFRRLMGLEIISILPIAVLLPIFSWIGLLFGQKTLWLFGFLVGLAVSLPIRFLSTDAMSSLPAWRKLFAALTTPILISTSFLGLSYALLPGSSLQTLVPGILILIVTCSIVSALGVSLIIERVEQSGRAEIGHSPMGLFRAFLHHWLRKTPTALEERLLSLSTEGSIETKILSFSGEDSRPKASLVVSNFHPGPYREMEDLPTSVATEIEREASRQGFEVLIVDAHNSIVSQTSITPLQAGRIVAAAVRVLGRLRALSQGPFSVGSAYDALKSYSLKEGIGPGGLSVMVVRTGSDAVSYITIDGNNMQQGFRDKILQAIRETGVSDAEVMTTDTHLVTGLVRSPLGYYPVGAALPTATFVTQITQSVKKAMANLEESSAGFSKFSLQLQVLGSETFQSITGFIGRIPGPLWRPFYWLGIDTFANPFVIVL